LAIELQHELNTSTRLRVIVAEERYLGKGTVSLAGVVARFAEEFVAALPAPLRFVSVSETENAT